MRTEEKPNKMQFTRQQLEELVEATGAEVTSREAWRHGHMEIIVVPFEGKFYRVTIPVHNSDGWQVFGPVEAVEVTKVEVMKHEWRNV